LDFYLKDEIDHLQSLLWRSETQCNIAIYIRALTPARMQLHSVKFGELQRSNPRERFLFVYLRMVSGRQSAYDLYSSNRVGRYIVFGTVKAAMVHLHVI